MGGKTLQKTGFISKIINVERVETLPRSGQRKYKMGLKYLLVPESKEVFTGGKKKKKKDDSMS